MALGRLYLVATPRDGMPEREFLARVRAALDGGVDLLQLRCKTLEALAYLRLAERVQEIAGAAGVPLIVNDRPDVALAAGVAGVHLGQGDLPVEWARRILPDAVVGRSTHEVVQASRAIAERADYIAVGPVRATPTKPGRPPVGLGYVREIAGLGIAVPWFAIGGITLNLVEPLLAAGATRVAVVRAILDAADPAEAASGFAAALGSVPCV